MIEVKLFLFKLISMRQYNYVHRADHSSVQTGMYACGFPSKWGRRHIACTVSALSGHHTKLCTRDQK